MGNNEAQVKSLLQDVPDIDHRDEGEAAVLQPAAMEGNGRICKMLLRKELI
jgi:hypothetical protein